MPRPFVVLYCITMWLSLVTVWLMMMGPSFSPVTVCWLMMVGGAGHRDLVELLLPYSEMSETVDELMDWGE